LYPGNGPALLLYLRSEGGSGVVKYKVIRKIRNTEEIKAMLVLDPLNIVHVQMKLCELLYVM